MNIKPVVLLLFLAIFKSYTLVANPIPGKSSSNLFLHVDKSIYLNGETIWFAGYFLTSDTQVLKKHDILTVLVSRADSGQVLISEKYPMDHGLSTGKLMLPDQIKPGIYKLLAFTNVVNGDGKPIAVFNGIVTVGNIALGTQELLSATKIHATPEQPHIKALLSTDQKVYGTRRKVTVKIKLQDNLGNPEQSIFSIAAVYQTRLNDDLKKIPYAVIDAAGAQADTKKLFVSAKVRHQQKALKQPVAVAFIGGDKFNVQTTDSNGVLRLRRDDLFTSYGKKIATMISGGRNDRYQIEIVDPLEQAGTLLARGAVVASDSLAYLWKHSANLREKSLERALNLDTVTVKIKGGNNAAKRGEVGINDCGDWVDEYDYLNYPYSQKRYHPVVGQLYKKRTDLNGSYFKVEPVHYTGCPTTKEKNATLFKGINLESLFYGLDVSSNQPQYLTTLFWGSKLLSTENGEAELSFLTSDLIGEYHVILQGITKDQVSYGAATFTVQ